MKKISTAVMVRAALLGAMGAVLMQLDLSLPIFPQFYKLDAGDLPILVGAITTGPLTGFLAAMIKIFLDSIIFGTRTFGIGEFANFLMSVSLIVPFGCVFRWRQDNVGYLIGCAAGILSLLIVSSLTNYFILIPFYSNLYRLPVERIVEIVNAVNSNVTDLPTLILFATIPFNLLKGTIILTLGFAVYKSMRPIIARLSKTQ
ncbi:MAG: ECF transporter S component [Clostridiales bacterium]|nr:ECF transporter S component [Clostridiales bacterium]